MNARAINGKNGGDFMLPVFDWGYKLEETSKYFRQRTATELVLNRLIDY